jgi:hypothetical protein
MPTGISEIPHVPFILARIHPRSNSYMVRLGLILFLLSATFPARGSPSHFLPQQSDLSSSAWSHLFFFLRCQSRLYKHASASPSHASPLSYRPLPSSPFVPLFTCHSPLASRLSPQALLPTSRGPPPRRYKSASSIPVSPCYARRA